MVLYYSLRIDAVDESHHLIDQLLGVKSNTPPFWEIQFTQNENDEYISYIEFFLSILEGKYNQLNKIGVARENISIWVFYEYDGQCNLEFSPSDLLKIGKEGITLCISCWEGNKINTNF